MNRTAILAIPLLAALALTACNKKPADAETKVSINTGEGEGATATASANGKDHVSASASGFDIDGDDFDIDGVDLYPGSVIKTMNVDAVRKAGNKVSTVKAGFESPTDAKTLTDWFEAEMKKEKFTFTRAGYDLSGTTDDGDAFTLKISDLGGGKANGLVVITDKD